MACEQLKARQSVMEPERRAELQRAWADYFEGLREDGRIRQSRPYLITLGRRR